MSIGQIRWWCERRADQNYLISSAQYWGKTWYAAVPVDSWGDVMSDMKLCVYAHERSYDHETCAATGEHKYFPMADGCTKFCVRCRDKRTIPNESSP